jgi:hypothetical protein
MSYKEQIKAAFIQYLNSREDAVELMDSGLYDLDKLDAVAKEHNVNRNDLYFTMSAAIFRNAYPDVDDAVEFQAKRKGWN